MKTTFPSLASLLLACCGWCASVLAQGSDAALPAAEEALRAAIAALDRYETVVAKVRQRSEVMEKTVSGTGTYVQGPARYNLVRLELSLQIEEHPCSLLQICDGKQLWTHRIQFGETRLTCLDAERVLAALQKNEAAANKAAIPGLALGGLPRMVRELEQCFLFTEIKDAELGTFPVRVLKGQWRTDRLKRFLPEQAAAIDAGQPADLAKLPAHVPDEVQLFLGRGDLFPYRLECHRRHSVAIKPQTSPPQVQFALEFYEVRVNTPIEPLRFVYTPATARYTDETETYLSSRGLK